MNSRLDNLLVKKFPNLFTDRHASMQVTAMCWGFDCGDGWYKIIKEAAEKLEPLIVAMKKRDPETFCRAIQIKEKYGTLCFYLTTGTDEMYDIAEEAERKSAKICEVCGKSGTLRGRGWLYTACDPHTKAEDR